MLLVLAVFLGEGTAKAKFMVRKLSSGPFIFVKVDQPMPGHYPVNSKEEWTKKYYENGGTQQNEKIEQTFKLYHSAVLKVGEVIVQIANIQNPSVPDENAKVKTPILSYADLPTTTQIKIWNALPQLGVEKVLGQPTLVGITILAITHDLVQLDALPNLPKDFGSEVFALERASYIPFSVIKNNNVDKIIGSELTQEWKPLLSNFVRFLHITRRDGKLQQIDLYDNSDKSSTDLFKIVKQKLKVLQLKEKIFLHHTL